MKNLNKKAFTLLEILLVVAAIAVLAGIVILAINPNKQLGDTRDAQRYSDISTLNKALISYQIDKKGVLPVGFPVVLTEICNTGNKLPEEVLPGDCDGFYDLSFLVPDYLVAIPKDPSIVSQGMIETAYAALNGTGYEVYLRNDRFAFWAANAETKTIAINLTEEDLEEEPEWACGSDITYQTGVYSTIQIGTQCWFKENLNVTKYRNGDDITDGASNWYEWDNLIGKWCYLNNNPSNEIYGKLYNWYAITDTREICPAGWHVPNEANWNTLETHLGTDPGTKLKVTASNTPPWDGDNSSGFAALPAGIRWSGGSFSSWGVSYFWTSDVSGESGTNRELASWVASITHNTNDKSEGLSVRCLKD
jgi:uncharacterized protein (TIGR02145 family)/prepilin-type N-terminal cleavage/methylation domain-containing protein